MNFIDIIYTYIYSIKTLRRIKANLERAKLHRRSWF